MDPQHVSALMIFALTACVTPGPNNLMLMMSGNLFGWRASLPHIAGIIIGFAFMVVCAVYGLTLLLERLPWLTWGVRLVGTAWLGWLGLKFIIAAQQATQSDAPEARNGAARPLRFYEAVLFQWANPKSLIVATSATSAFLHVASAPLERAIIIAGGFSLAGLVSTHLWTLSGSALSVLLSTGKHAYMMQIAMGILLLLTAASLLFI